MLTRHLLAALIPMTATVLAQLDEYDAFPDFRIGEMAPVQNFVRNSHLDFHKRSFQQKQAIDPDDVVEIGDWDVQSITLSPGEDSDIYAFKLTTSNESAVSAYYLSANIGDFPNSEVASWSESEIKKYFGLRFYVNSTTGAWIETFTDGYLSDIAYFTNKLEALDAVLYVEPYFNANSSLFNDTDTFVMEFGISGDDIVFQWDNGTFASLVDADDDSVILSTQLNTTSESASELKNQSASIVWHVFDEEAYAKLDGLTKSWLAVTQGVPVVEPDTVEITYSESAGALNEQFYIEGLNSSTKYYAVATIPYSSSHYGGIVYTALNFTTQREGVCELVYGLNFCTNVAYSVPQSADFAVDSNKTALIQLYDDYASSVYQNFSYAMQLISCDAETDARFSPISTCDDCVQAYKNWLCAVLIPRCSTDSNEYFYNRTAGSMRTQELSERIDPPENWSEVLPCIDLCHSIVKFCPSDFGFQCPTDEELILESYNYYESSVAYSTCNNVGSGTTTAKRSGGSKVNVSIFTLMVMSMSWLWFI